MRVMITGATGFVGFHTARALMDAGHEVSLLVRSVDKMLKLFGDDTIEHYTHGDITEADKVAAAMEGCDAVVHSAAMVSTEAADAERVYNTNVNGAKTVIDTALAQGIGAIIHVSSVTALYDPKASLLDEHSPPGTAVNAYGRSKVDCEKYVRKLQANGEPIYITYPATVIGPDDPGLTEAHVGLQGYLMAFVPLMPSGNQYVDVRDVAEVHLRLLSEQPEFGRYTLGGHFLPWAELAEKLEQITGRKLLKIPLMGGFMRATGRLFDYINKYVPMHVPLTEEAMGYATNWVEMDNSKVEEALDFEFRSADESFGDAIKWLADAGHIKKEQAGKLA